MATSSVRFVEGRGRILSELEIETAGRTDLAAVLAQTLFDLRVQIVHLEIRNCDQRLRARLVIVEFDGAHITPSRRAEVQAAVMSAIEITARRERKAYRYAEPARFEATS